MPTAIEPMNRGLRRRQLLAAATALAFTGRVFADSPRPIILATAWGDALGKHYIGLVQIDAAAARVLDSIEVPTRAHGLACPGDGSLLAVARRSGDWLLRWRVGKAQAVNWIWAEGERRFNGHVFAAADGQAIFTTESELGSGQGRLVRRNPATLEATAVWSTHGADPHDMEWLPGRQILVANGGITTLPETGRVKRDLDQMDSSLVRIDLQTGKVSGQWWLADQRLSIRHLARHHSGLVGAALQAEHDDATSRSAAPLLALFDPVAATLRPKTEIRSAAGYGGDIAALRDCWLLSCPHDNLFQRLPLDGRSAQAIALNGACAMAPTSGARNAWISGNAELRRVDHATTFDALPPGGRFDNHSVLWSG